MAASDNSIAAGSDSIELINAIKALIELRGITQEELADLADMSRVQVNRILNGAWSKTRESTRNSLLRALGVDESDLLERGDLDRYRAYVKEKYRIQSLAGLGFAELHRQPLDAIYVTPLASDLSRDCGNDEEGQENPSKVHLIEIESTVDSRPATDFVNQFNRIVVLGVPGAGKTTLIHFLAGQAAARKRGDVDLPVVVRLPEYSLALEDQPNLNFIDWVVSQAEAGGCENTGPAFRAMLEESPASIELLLDGLDEVPDSGSAAGQSSRRKVVDSIESFIRLHPSHRFVLTSRLNGFNHVPWTQLGFKQIRLQEYGEKQIHEVVSKWARVLASSKTEPAERIENELKDAIFGNSRIRQLAGNPLILTILILMCKARGYVLPRRRVDLYDKITEVFLDTWEASKRKEFGFREIAHIDLDPRELKWLIAELALAMQRAGLVSARRWWIVEHLQATLCQRLGFDANTAKRQTDPILAFISDRAGLLEQRISGVFAFTHRTLQEYFSAIGLEQESEHSTNSSGLCTLLKPYLYHPEWAEVVRLVAAHVSPSRAEELLRLITDDPDPTGRFLRRGPLLALRCLADGATIPDRQFTQSVFDSFANLGYSPWIGILSELFRILRLMDGTRHEESAVRLREIILVSASKTYSSDDLRYLTSVSKRSSSEIELSVTKSELNEPVLHRTVTLEGQEESHFFPNFQLLSGDPVRWQEAAIKWLKKKDLADEAKMHLVWGVTMNARHVPEGRRNISNVLESIMESDANSELRAGAFEAFLDLKAFKDTVRHEFLSNRLFDRKQPNEFRIICIRKLSQSGPLPNAIWELFLKILASPNESELVRIEAARALGEIAADETMVKQKLLDLASAEKPSRLSAICVEALQSICSEMPDKFHTWATDQSHLSVAACLVLSKEYSTRRLEWDTEKIQEVERTLISVGLGHYGNSKPCNHMLQALRSLSDARASSGGMRLECVLRDMLKQFAGSIRFAFVYGSTARNQQSMDSDIDIMLIGSITQRDLSGVIKPAESILGREIKPTNYTMEQFIEKYDEENRFVKEVMENAKLFIEVNGQTRSEEELTNELRAVAQK